MEKREELYRGKAKSVYQTDDADRLILLFRNDTSAFDGKRIEQLDRKGAVNNKFNAFIPDSSHLRVVPEERRPGRSVHQRIPRPGLRLGHSRAAGADEDLFLQGQ